MRDKPHLEEVEEQAWLLALGALPSEEEAHFRQRVTAGCPLCCSLLNDCEQTVAALPLLAPEVAPPPMLRTRLLEGIGVKAAPAERPALEWTLVRAGDTDWEPSPIPGVQYRRLHGRKTMLVRMAPHTVYPEHEHAWAEQCLVLEGSVRTEGEIAYAGDFTYMPKGSTHQPLHTETGCLLLIAYT
jgi:mannose-6-phosphate isomerase-like protein (cupin superfamily)